MLIDINLTGIISNRIAEGAEEGTMQNQNPEKNGRIVREGLKEIDKNVLGNLPVRIDKSRPENVGK